MTAHSWWRIEATGRRREYTGRYLKLSVYIVSRSFSMLNLLVSLSEVRKSRNAGVNRRAVIGGPA